MPYFRAFSAFSVTATNFMNSITFVMNHLISYFDISICHCSNRTLCYHLFKFHGFNYGYFLGGACYIHLTMGTNAVFLGFFSLFGHGNQLYELNHFRDESSYFDISICHCINRTLCYHLFKFHGFNHGYFLGGYCYIHLTMKTSYAKRTYIE